MDLRAKIWVIYMSCNIEHCTNRIVRDIADMVRYTSEKHSPESDFNYLNWLLMKNPTGKALVVSKCIQNKLVGFLFLVPVPIQSVLGHDIIYLISGVKVKDEYRGAGIFQEMINYIIEFVSSKKIAICGYPNQNALHGWKKNNMSFCPNLIPRVVSRCQWMRFKGLYDEENQNETKDIQQSVFKLNVTEKYINWRYLQHPLYDYRICLSSDGNDDKTLLVFRKVLPFIYTNILVKSGYSARSAKECKPPILSLAYYSKIIKIGAQIPLISKKREKPFFYFYRNKDLKADMFTYSSLEFSDY